MGSSIDLSEEEQKLIKNEFKRIEGKYYLDHTGTTLYSEKQVDAVGEVLKQNLLCNPHSSKITEDLIDQVRFRVLKHFNTDANHYSLVFTSGTTAALKTVGECFDFGTNGNFVYTQENHTSVVGMRDVVNTGNVYVLTRNQLLKNLQEQNLQQKNVVKKDGNCLVTFAAQCNFSGYKYPLEIVDKIHANGLVDSGVCIRHNNTNNSDTINENNYYVCLDAAAYAPTSFLDLSLYKPDYVCISFYKIFGLPTGLGALIVSKRGQDRLIKKYFGGGTVNIAMSTADFHEKRHNFHERFEDGTIPFLSIVSLLSGFHTIERLIPPRNNANSMQRISNHVFELAKYCYKSLKDLHYSNKKPLVKFHSHTDYTNIKTQGGIVAFNLLHDDGSFVGFAEVACIASIYNIILRTGCFCNSGACQVFLDLDNDEIKRHHEAGHICGDYNDLVNGVPTGAVRVSFGYMTTKQDIDQVIFMLQDCYLREKSRLEIIENAKIPEALRHVPERLKKDGRVRLREICVYPIKSCGPLKTNKWEITECGLKYDRCWMIVNSDGVAMTQKAETRLCLIKPRIDLGAEVMTLQFPDKTPISIRLNLLDDEKSSVSASICQSKVCGDFVEGFDCGDEVADWLSDCLQISGLRLIQQRNDVERLNRDGTVKDINLSNIAQFLLINKTSVQWLASKVSDWEDVDSNDINGIVDRFRGNLIIETENPLEENDFEVIQIGNVQFNSQGFCTRCQMICIDQNTGLKTPEPLKTIAKEFKGKIRFGIYLSHTAQNSRVPIFISCKDYIHINK